jgi:acetyl esterase
MSNECYFNNNIETAKSPYLSPIYATKEQLTGLPPTLLIVAGDDSIHDEGVRYGEMLKAAGVDVEFHDFKDSVHGFTYYKKADAKIGHDLIADYIIRHI